MLLDRKKFVCSECEAITDCSMIVMCKECGHELQIAPDAFGVSGSTYNVTMHAFREYIDPDLTFMLMLTSYLDEHWNDAIKHSESLLSWLRRGGGPPQVTIVISEDGRLFDFDDESLNRVAAAAFARKILSSAKQATLVG